MVLYSRYQQGQSSPAETEDRQMINVTLKSAIKYALASCDIHGKIIEIDDAAYWDASESEAEAALKVGGYVKISNNIWNATMPSGKQLYACIVQFS